MQTSKYRPFGTEIHQLDWVPGFLKERQLEQIFPILKAVKFDSKLLTLFNRLRERTGASQYIDLGSGAGNVVEYLVKNAEGSYTYTLSDLQPRLDCYRQIQRRNQGRIDFVPYSVDIAQADGILKNKAVTIITTFHELPKAEAVQVIKNLIKNSKGFLIAEPVNKSAFQFIKLPWITLYFWLAPLWARSKSFTRYLFTWLWPVLPLFHAHDGLVSLLRSYNKKDFEKMLNDCATADWEWEVGNLGSDTTYVLAWRKSAA